MTTRILAATALIALCISAARSQAVDFTAIDADTSGGLSLEEIRAVTPDIADVDFSLHDRDASGELSVEEYAALVASQTGMQQ